jgi:hypothetical protein
MEQAHNVHTQEHNQAHAVHSPVHANFDNKVDSREFKFHFRKDDLGNKRASVELKLPVPSVEGVIDILSKGGKQLDLLLDTIADVIAAQARAYVDETQDVTQDNFPHHKATWEYISNLEKAARRGGGIPKETWEAFAKDYIEVMPSITGKTTEAISNGAKILLNKFSAVKTNKPVINLLKAQVSLYLSNSTNAEQFTDCIEFLLNKADTLLNMTEADLLANL